MDESGFKGCKTGEKIAALLRELDVPLQIPERLEHLVELASSKGWEHGPHAIAKIRNNAVHPKKKFEASTRVHFEAWTMAQWFIELALLSLFGYDGTYVNRIKWARWEGEVESVPWT